eukprot:Gb_01116 [translate_table: standard]
MKAQHAKHYRGFTKGMKTLLSSLNQDHLILMKDLFQMLSNNQVQTSVAIWMLATCPTRWSEAAFVGENIRLQVQRTMETWILDAILRGEESSTCLLEGITVQPFRKHNYLMQVRIQVLLVVPVLFEHSLSPPKNVLVFNLDHNAREDPQHITSPPTDCEVVLALRVLEGCCLLDRDSRTVAHQHMAIKVCFQ